MTHIHEAIFALNPSIVIIRGDVAYDKDESIVEYDLKAAEAKLEELQFAEAAAQETAIAAKESALAKLYKLGLTDAEIAALTGN